MKINLENWIQILGIFFIACVIALFYITITTDNKNNLLNDENEKTKVDSLAIELKLPSEENNNDILKELIKERLKDKAKVKGVSYDANYEKHALEYVIFYLEMNIECPKNNNNLDTKISNVIDSILKHSEQFEQSRKFDRSTFMKFVLK